jgi:hypothetical protein
MKEVNTGKSVSSDSDMKQVNAGKSGSSHSDMKQVNTGKSAPRLTCIYLFHVRI